jgi:DNA-binding Lrp family transcriptional regulator
MSHTGIAKRISKLENSGILKVQGNISVKNSDFKAAFILMEMRNHSDVQKIIEEYSECPRVFMLAPVTGQYNLMFGVLGRNNDVLRRYINLCGPTNKEGLLHSTILFTSNFLIPKHLPSNLFSESSKEHVCKNICRGCEAFLDGDCEGCGNF